MDLPQSRQQITFRDEIKPLEADILAVADGSAPKKRYASLQTRLDRLARKYQHQEELGSSRYKLYELQALLYYAQERDYDAKSFIDAAIETRGSSYKRAEQLLDRLKHSEMSISPDDTERVEDTDALSKEERRRRQIGLEGWLAVFIVGMGLGIVLNVVSLLEYPSAFGDLRTASEVSPGVVSDFTPILWFEVIMHLAFIATGIYILILMAKHRAVAKTTAIIYMVTLVVYGGIDYAWGSALYEQYDLDTGDLDKFAGEWGRSVIYAVIWIPYLLIAKRVKATLTK